MDAPCPHRKARLLIDPTHGTYQFMCVRCLVFTAEQTTSLGAYREWLRLRRVDQVLAILESEGGDA